MCDVDQAPGPVLISATDVAGYGQVSHTDYITVQLSLKVSCTRQYYLQCTLSLTFIVTLSTDLEHCFIVLSDCAPCTQITVSSTKYSQFYTNF